MTNRCKNITLATTSLWPVKRSHSSRMSTAHLSTVSQHALHRGCLSRGVSVQGGVCLGVSTQGVSAQGVSAQVEGVSAQGRGCLPRGVSAQRGVVCRGYLPKGSVCPGGCVSQHAMGQTPPLWTEFLTHACENITLPQLRCGR